MKKIGLYFFILIHFSAYSSEFRNDSLLAVPYDEMVGDLSKYERIYTSLIPIYKEEKNDLQLAKVYEKLLIIYHLSNDFEKAIKFGTDAAAIYHKNGEYGKQASALGSLGMSLKSIDFEKGKKYMLEAIQIAEQNDSTVLSPLYNNYGLFKKDRNEYDSALYYYSKALKIDRSAKDSVGLPYVFDHIGEIYLLQSKFDEARALFENSYSIRLKRNDNYGIVDSELYLGDLFFEQKQYTKAKEWYNSALLNAKKSSILILYKYALGQLVKIAQEEKDYKNALNYQLELSEIKDSLLNDERNKEIARLEAKFDTEKKERDLLSTQLKLTQEKEANAVLNLESKNRLIGMLIISGVSLIILILSYFIIRNFRHKRKQDLREFEFTKQIEKERAEKKIVEEKVRVSRELHDNIGARVTFLVSSIDNLTYAKVDEKVKNKLEKLADFGRGTMADLRSTVWAMKMENGTLQDLLDRINGLKQHIEMPVSAECSVDTSLNLSAIELLNLFRIVQEAIQNAMKYSSCSQIRIKIEKANENLQVSIEDEGIGFHLNEIKMGNGLRNMKHRCEACNGQFTVDSNPDFGTKIVCAIPENHFYSPNLNSDVV